MKGDISKKYNPNSYNALDVSVAFIIILLLFVVLEVVVAVTARRLIAENENFDYYLYLCVSVILTQGLIFASAFVFSRLRGVPLFDGGGFVYKFDIIGILFGVILASGIYFLVFSAHFTFTENVFEVFYGLDYEEYTTQLNELYTGNEFYALLYIYILTPLLPCIAEEVFFRGIVMRGLRQFGVTASVVLSTMCFTLMHGNVEQIVLQFCLGLAIGATVTITGNFMIGAAMHFSNNLFVSLYSVNSSIVGELSAGGEEFADSVYIILGIIFIIVGGYYFINLAIKNKERKIKNTPREIALKEQSYYAVVKRNGEAAQRLYPVQVNDAILSDGTFYYLSKNGFKRVNKRANAYLSAILLAVGLIGSVIIIFWS